MPSRISSLFRPVLGLTAFALLLVFTGSSNAQGENQLGTVQSVETPYTKAANRTLLRRLLLGEETFDANNKLHTDVLDLCAKYMTYRFTWVIYYAPKEAAEVGKIDKIFNEFEDAQKQILRNKTSQQDIAKGFTTAIITRARDVLNQTKPNIARVNAARMLALLAPLKQPELADALLDVFTQEVARPRSMDRNDGVIYYALHGLRDLLALPAPPPPDKPLLSPERQQKIATALMAFVMKAPEFPKDPPKEEIGGYCALRREAVRALSYSRPPADMKNKDRPGMTLLRIVARDGFTPEPRIDESVEAALGVARMRTALDGKDYQPDYAAYVLGQFVDSFGLYYLAKMKDEQRPYKIYAAKLLEALEAMKTDTKSPYVLEVVEQCRKVLTPMEKGEQVKTTDLHNFLEAKPPTKQGLFEGAESTVKAPNRAAEMP